MGARAGARLSEASTAARLRDPGLVRGLPASRLGLHAVGGADAVGRSLPCLRGLRTLARRRKARRGAVPPRRHSVLQFSRPEIRPELGPDPAVGARDARFHALAGDAPSGWAVILGLAAAAAMLVKYWSFFVLAAMALALLFDRRCGAYLRSRA